MQHPNVCERQKINMRFKLCSHITKFIPIFLARESHQNYYILENRILVLSFITCEQGFTTFSEISHRISTSYLRNALSWWVITCRNETSKHLNLQRSRHSNSKDRQCGTVWISSPETFTLSGQTELHFPQWTRKQQSGHEDRSVPTTRVCVVDLS